MSRNSSKKVRSLKLKTPGDSSTSFDSKSAFSLWINVCLETLNNNRDWKDLGNAL
jgi:hypothetical protein